MLVNIELSALTCYSLNSALLTHVQSRIPLGKLTWIVATKADMGVLQILCVVYHDEAVVAVTVAIRARERAHVLLRRLHGSSVMLRRSGAN